MMKILKASAGSGKTYRLTRDYITLLLQNPDRYAYRHILAVTFTNKATAEMKSRILSELSVLAKTPEQSDYYGSFVPSLYPGPDKLRDRASEILVNILHDYSAFAVSTIDSFFQQTLKAFSREIGYFASYQVELDRDSLIQEAVDRMLDSITEDDREMLSWLDETVFSGLEQGSRVNLAGSIFENARNLKSPEHGTLLTEHGLDDGEMFSRERLKQIRKECVAYIKSYESAVQKAAKDVRDTLNRCGVDPADSNRKFLQSVVDYALRPDPKKGYGAPSDSVMEKAGDPQQWFAKGKAPKLLPQVEGILEAPLAAFCELFSGRYRLYRTALLLKDQIYTLGIAGEFFRNFDDLVKEKNVLCLDDSNEILRKIIGGSDAPFVYEKLGVRYEHFLLDEFQDTSRIQWDNFLPLLRESESNRHENLVVGDVKQSIYRWRGSDWKLLGSTLQSQFPSAETEVLDSNWRSTRTVVEFNNSFFAFAAQALGSDILNQYSDVYQKSGIRNEPQTGYVRVDFTAESQLELILQSVRDAVASGAQPGDIVILVRNNGNGSDVANYLIENGIPVISDDSLDVKSSLVVRRLVSLLSWVNNPDDGIDCYLASQLIPQGEEDEWRMEWHSLTDLCESLLRLMQRRSPGCTDGQVLFIQSFMDCLQEWTAANGQNLQAFLDYFDGASLKISSPQDKSSVRVMTVHKSKGLEFPYVIFPFAETVSMSKTSTHWCYLDGANPGFTLPDGSRALTSAAGGIYPLNLSSSLQSTLFSRDYEEDRFQKEMDCINLFYVALTRASKSLHIIAKMPSKKTRDAGPEGLAEYSDLSQLLYIHLRGRLDENGSCSFGEFYDFTRMKRKASAETPCTCACPSYALGGRLSFPEDASDFFGEDGAAGTKSSQRLNGIVLHDILSTVREPGDLRGAVEEAVRSGRLEAEDAERDCVMLASRLASAVSRGWFPANARVITETDIIAEDGSLYRPDRVVIAGNGVIVVDYKFGSRRAAYEKQVADYMRLYERMGYASVRGFLWYVYTDEVVECQI
jgi:ATP-dependent helicase/nuclease subunit A